MTNRNLLAAMFLALLAAPVASAPADEFGLGKDVDQCRKDPRFRVGGAAIGDCLLERSEAVDRQIAALLQRAATRYCRAEDREVLRQSQAQWSSYRQRYCDLVEASPGNTPAFVNGASCRLVLARDRLKALSLVVNHGSAQCPGGVGRP